MLTPVTRATVTGCFGERDSTFKIQWQHSDTEFLWHNTAAAEAAHGVFTRDQVEILSARKGEPEWLRERRRRTSSSPRLPMPDTRPEEWRYTDIGTLLKLEALGLAEERAPVARRRAAGGAARADREPARRRAGWCRWTPRWCSASCRRSWPRRG
jgi:serine/threonine protein kinase HipA of HipAB toxin-antitoxin module